MDSLLVALRQETKDIHLALHKNSTLKRCQENKLDLGEYVQMLLAFYQPWKKLMSSLDDVPIKDLRPVLAKRHQLLYYDLINLNVDEKTLALQKKEQLSQGQLLGIGYVVIGSSMGATGLSQNIKKTLGDQPISYLSMSPKEAGWPLLSSFLKSKEVKDYPKTSTSARNTFKLIQTYLSNLAYI